MLLTIKMGLEGLRKDGYKLTGESAVDFFTGNGRVRCLERLRPHRRGTFSLFRAYVPPGLGLCLILLCVLRVFIVLIMQLGSKKWKGEQADVWVDSDGVAAWEAGWLHG